MKYYATVMSIDPYEDEEDQHQKYAVTVDDAEDDSDARIQAENIFNQRHPGLPIEWIEVIKA